MASYSKSRSSQLHRSPSPTRFCSSSISNFVTRPAPVLARSTSPSRISLGRSSSTSNHQKSNFVTRPAPVLARSTSPTRISLGLSSSSAVIFSTSNHQKSNTSPISNFVTRPAPVIARSTSPTRISHGRSSSSSVRFSTPNHRQHDQKSNTRPLSSAPKKTCACSPSTHPGSFRCSLHKNNPAPGHVNNQTASSNHQLNMRRSTMKNSLVRIGTVEGDLAKRALASLIRPSSLNQRRQDDFHPRPSRLSIMSKAEES